MATTRSHDGGIDTQSSSTQRDEMPSLDVEKQQGEHPAHDTPDEPVDEIDDFPEGGLQAWGCVVGTFIVMAFSFGYLNAYGTFQAFYTSSFLQGYTQSDIAWIGATQYFFIFGVGLFAGRAFDLGLFKPLMAFAIILTTL